jgi:hypothetical protein
MLKINLRMQALVVQLNTRVNQAQGQVAAANTLARQAQAACNDRGPYHWTTEPKSMLRCPFDSKLLYF